MMYRRPRHNATHKALLQFDKAFLLENKVLFGGDTRIAMELDEFRESVDIDFVCPSIESYRAVRSAVSSSSFGDLVNGELELIREIRADRYGVRTAIKVNDTPIKLEFISFSDYRLSMAETTSLPVPALDQDSCYITKLLALADRYAFPDKKDFIDLLTMQRKWGAPSQKAWAEVKRHYGEAPFKTLHKQLDMFLAYPEPILSAAAKLDITDEATLENLHQSAGEWIVKLKHDLEDNHQLTDGPNLG